LRRTFWLAFTLLALWIVVAGFAASRHEMWRDEVRPLTLAREASSPLDLYRRAEYDGHPMLWFLLLYAAYGALGTKLVLPGLALLLAAAAVALFLFAAPFPLPVRALFAFGALPLYEYAVMARNYGITMLLLFLAALFYRERAAHPWRLALVLALLANTNLHAAILACLLAGLWLWDAWREGERRWPILPILLVTLGVAFSLLCALPRPSSNLTTIYSTSPGRVVRALLASAKLPDWTFFMLLPPSFPEVVNRTILWLAVAGLAVRPALALAAGGSALALGVLFRVGVLRLLPAPGPLPALSGDALLDRVGSTPGGMAAPSAAGRPLSRGPAAAAGAAGAQPADDRPGPRQAVQLEPGARLLPARLAALPGRRAPPRARLVPGVPSLLRGECAVLPAGAALRHDGVLDARPGGAPHAGGSAGERAGAGAADGEARPPRPGMGPHRARRGQEGRLRADVHLDDPEWEAFARETTPVATFDRATTDENYRVYALRGAPRD
jgi:hypothetical protein